MKFVNNFEDWVRMEYINFISVSKDAYVENLFGIHCLDMRYEILYYGKKTIIIDKKTGKTGIAKCREGDKFSPSIGTAIAWARLKGEEIPVEYKTTRLKTLKVGDKFIIANNKDFKETYTFVGRYNFESIDKCFCATGEKLENLVAFHPNTVVIKL